MVNVKSKVKAKKATKKPYPKLFGKPITKPGYFYAGGAIHYLNKEGRIVHDSKIRTQAELKKLVMSDTEFNKRYGSVTKKKNPSLESEIHDIERMKRMLSSWNLKYDVFPNVEEYVNKHWTQTYGRQEALELLMAAMNQRADLYHNVERLIPPGGTRAGKRLEKAESNWAKVKDRLQGIETIEDREVISPKALIPKKNSFGDDNWEWDV
jgi:hypothetical protein